MSKAPFNIFTIPYFIKPDASIEYAIFKRSDEGYWQFIAGGGEDDETSLQAAQRESFEEAGITSDSKYTDLEYAEQLRVEDVRGYLWGPDEKTIPNYGFAVEVKSRNITLSHEHTEYKWVSIEEALKMLKWGGNKKALNKLHRIVYSKITA